MSLGNSEDSEHEHIHDRNARRQRPGGNREKQIERDEAGFLSHERDDGL
jgi:hypothetical protein